MPARLSGEYTRDEQEQATCLRQLLETFEAEGVDTAFVFTFASYELPHRAGDPRQDLDLASYGVVKVRDHGCGAAYPDMARSRSWRSSRLRRISAGGRAKT